MSPPPKCLFSRSSKKALSALLENMLPPLTSAIERRRVETGFRNPAIIISRNPSMTSAVDIPNLPSNTAMTLNCPPPQSAVQQIQKDCVSKLTHQTQIRQLDQIYHTAAVAADQSPGLGNALNDRELSTMRVTSHHHRLTLMLVPSRPENGSNLETNQTTIFSSNYSSLRIWSVFGDCDLGEMMSFFAQ